MASAAARRTSPADPESGLTYAQAGVSIAEGDRFVDLIQRHMRRTHGPRVLHQAKGFAGLFRLDYDQHLFRRNFRDPVLVACADGVGTKIEIAIAMDEFASIGIDLVAMNLNDLVVQGAEPLIFLDYIACGKLIPERMERIVGGIAEACRRCGAALLGGETAEMPGVYGPDGIDLAGFAVGVAELGRVMDTERVEPGDVIIGLESDGLHSNGFSLARKVIEQAKLDLHSSYDELGTDEPLGHVLLTPTRLYARPIVRVLRRYKVKRVISGMAHITGGGLTSNLERALHDRVDAVIDHSMWEPPAIFPFLAERGGVPDEDMAQTFNMGLGYVLIVRESFAPSIEKQLTRLGERPHVIGRIEKGTGQVVG